MKLSGINYVGEVYSASTGDNIKLRLRADQLLENFQLGSYLTIIGKKNKYICKLIEISTKQIESGFAETNVAIREIFTNGLKIGSNDVALTGNPLFYNLVLKPLKAVSITQSESVDIQQPIISEPQTIPPIFTRVKRTSKEDLEIFFADTQNKSYVTIGTIRGTMDKEPIESKIELFKTQNLHAALFAKTGSGKTVLAKILSGHITAEKESCALIFDMHDEYGYKTVGTSGLKNYFKEKIYVMSVDPDKKQVDSHILIPHDYVRVSDVKVSLSLSQAQESVLYTLNELYGKDWMSILLKKDRVDEILLDSGGVTNEKTGKVTGGEIKRVTLNTLRREIKSRITSLKCFKEKTEINSIDTIVSMILKGKTVIVNFGQFSDDPMVYALITNLIARRMFETYRNKISNQSITGLRQVSIIIEEAHKFLNKSNIQSAFFGRFIREARKFKMGLIIIDQRPSKIDEEVLSQIGTLFVMQLTNAKDLRMLEEETEEGITEYISEIKRLNRREGIVLGQGTEFVQNFTIFDYTDESLLKKYWKIEDQDVSNFDRFD